MDELKFPKILVNEESYGDDYNKDCTFTHPEAIISLGRYGLMDQDISYLEPACGSGNLSDPLVKRGYEITSSDKMDWGYGSVLPFNSYEPDTYDVVITNPPFSLWEHFIRQSLLVARKRVFLLFPLRYLEGIKRSKILQDTELTAVLVFAYRLRMYRPNGVKLSGLTSFAWFYWDLENPTDTTTVDWLYR